MVDVQTISIAIASASVVAGVSYYALQIRHQTKMRRTDLLTRLYSIMISKDWLEAWQKVQERKALNYDDYLREYGSVEFLLHLQQHDAAPSRNHWDHLHTRIPNNTDLTARSSSPSPNSHKAKKNLEVSLTSPPFLTTTLQRGHLIEYALEQLRKTS